MRRYITRVLRFLTRRLPLLRRLTARSQQGELDALYALLYNLVHDRERSADVFATQTTHAFRQQWQTHQQGQYLLSDPWFRDNVANILSRQEILLQPEWFRGKDVLDAGCGNGRWSYGLAQLGVNLTSVDVNAVAVEETRRALADISIQKEFHQSPLEELTRVLPVGKQYDLVFCWGVAHHCRSFNQAIRELVKCVKDGGLLYLYLYGRDSIGIAEDLELFKERVRYHTLPTAEQQLAFLLDKTNGDRDLIHTVHDIYAPLINRRLTFVEVQELLESLGLHRVERTIEHTELFLRAFKGDSRALEPYLLPRAVPPYWFEHHARVGSRKQRRDVCHQD